MHDRWVIGTKQISAVRRLRTSKEAALPDSVSAEGSDCVAKETVSVW
jgi:hypothetical protein